jgi:hypothetical protein
MSIKIMSIVWDRGPENQAERFVLLALADYANDDGECWPSIEGVARKTCLTDRGVRKIMRRLEDTGWLSIEAGGGRKNCNLYRIKTLNTVQPERGSPLNVVPENPEPRSINPEHGSAEPSYNHKEPSESNNARAILDVLCEWASDEAARSFVTYRRKQKGKALTLTASKRMASQLEQIAQRGGDVDDALGMAEERGWQSVQADWYFNAKQPKGQTHGKRDGEAAERARRAGERAAARAMDFGEGGDALGPLFPAGQPIRSIGSGD